jgi:hypothetical protein
MHDEETESDKIFYIDGEGKSVAKVIKMRMKTDFKRYTFTFRALLRRGSILPFYNNTFWEDLIAYFPLIRHGPHRKRSVQKFYCCLCLCCCSNIFIVPLPSNDRGIYRLMAGIYEVCRWDGLRCYVIHTKFHEDWFRRSKLIMGDSQTQRQHGDLISLFLFKK